MDRAAASVGSGLIKQEIPKEFKLNVAIDYKSVFVSSGDTAVKTVFSELIHGGPYSFDNPEILCIVVKILQEVYMYMLVVMRECHQ